ncbi:hypothetical protein [Agromyces sp. Marseille-P2726]|uniref:hypothetical protein n=1 Tax=Agromyces sp. Marseille-P2726 TaxID=2709132 RepID=UPI00156E1110|nr:hypothetical protein [Agromyces sp. Marseille-P2726]
MSLVTGDRRSSTRAKGGLLVKVRHGAYVAPEDWPEREREAAHFIRMQAVDAAMRTRPVFSHRSAALVWGLPVIGISNRVDLVGFARQGGRTRRGIVWHNDAIRDDEVVEVDGMLVTSLVRTMVDLARTRDFAAAVAAVDRGLRSEFRSDLLGQVDGVPREQVIEAIERYPGRRGIRAARAVVAFADPRSDSAGESASRANMHLAGFPAPGLQVALERYDGGRDIVDFDWPDSGHFGEFDGRGKYLREEFTDGRALEEILLAEKDREDRIRRHRPFGIRWGWDIGTNLLRLRAHLIAHGLHPTR